jgi:dUTP pyrophosphatase
MIMELKVKRIHPDAKLPVYGHPGDAGLDLYAVVDRELAPGEVFAVPTGIQIAVPAGHAGLVESDSLDDTSRGQGGFGSTGLH